MGPAPAVAEVRRAVRAMLDGRDQVFVACSGGADSLALAAATAFVAPRLGIRAGLITVDHGLQPGSDEQAARVAALGYELGFDPVTVVRVEVGSTGGPEAAARDARYAALARTAGDAPVLLGHTLDDQAESVLLGLGRGSGSRSIAGMRAVSERASEHVSSALPGARSPAPVDGHWLRPFLGIRRAITEAACAALGLQAWDDPHNADPSFRRVRVRHEVLPLLEDVLAGGITEALARTADLVRADADALDQWARTVFDQVCAGNCRPGDPEPSDGGANVIELPVAGLTELPKAVRTRVLRLWATAHGATELTAERTAALDALITDWHGQAEVQLPGGVRVVRASERLKACPS